MVVQQCTMSLFEFMNLARSAQTSQLADSLSAAHQRLAQPFPIYLFR